MATSKMALVMVLAPHLATYTYASPHLIAKQSLGYVMSPLPSTPAALKATLPVERRIDVVEMVASEPTVSRSAEGLTYTELEGEEAVQTQHNFLIRKDDTWHSTPGMTADLVDGDLSDARLSLRTYESGAKEWEIESPITFQYRVRECQDVLSPDSDVLIYGHLTDDASLARAKARPLKRVVVVDDQVYALFGERIDAYFAHHGVQTRMLVLPTTEENKNIELALQIAREIHELGIDRRLDPVIAIGGGVCMDIVGFAASIYRRRTPYVRVPTTLMGYVDASVGAKSGVNFHTESDGWRKNKLGSYLPPALSILDRSFLATLDARQLSNGAAEIMKMALVKDPELFALLEDHGPQLIESKFQALEPTVGGADGTEAPSRVLFLAIQTMLEELAPNLWEDSLERLVDFGHVFSMELEMEQLEVEKLFHGEAVAIDMAFCTVLAHVRGQIDADECHRILAATKGLGLPIIHPAFNADMVDQALYERVKFSQGQKIPLPTKLGESRLFNDITMEQCHEALELWPELAAKA